MKKNQKKACTTMHHASSFQQFAMKLLQQHNLLQFDDRKHNIKEYKNIEKTKKQKNIENTISKNIKTLRKH